MRFVHFLIFFTFVTMVCVSVTMNNVLQIALNSSPNFSAAILRQGHWEEIIDFVQQVPPQKLAYIFLTHNSANMLLILIVSINIILALAWALQWLCFSTCTYTELRAARETSLQFMVFRLIFLGSVLESGMRPATTPSANDVMAPGSGSTREVCLWLMWFSIIGLLRWFLVLLRERFQSAQASAFATVNTFLKYLVVGVVLTNVNIAIGIVVTVLFHAHTSWTVLSLLVFENVVLVVSCVKIIYRYFLQIRALQKDQPFEERGSSLFYADMAADMVVQLLTTAHLLHIWSHYGLSFSLIDIFLFLHIRQLTVGVYRNFQAIRAYARAINEINSRFPDATPEELRIADDVCSICRDGMEQGAKKLPCNHYFHRSCLQQWIEHQSMECPTCRAPLMPRPVAGPAAHAQPRQPAGVPQLDQAAMAQQQLALAHFANRANAAAALAAHGFGPLPAPAAQPQPQVHAHGGIGAPDGLRHRFPGNAPAGAPVLGQAPSSSAGSAAAASPRGSGQPRSPPDGHGHSHGPAGHSHAHHPHSHGGPVAGGAAAGGHAHVQPLFRIDTSRYSWLPNFSLEVQSVQEGQMGPAVPSAASSSSSSSSAPTQVMDDDMPPLEPIESNEGQPNVHTPTSGTPVASLLSEPPNLTLRERIFLATQRRLQLEREAAEQTNQPGESATAVSTTEQSSSSSSPMAVDVPSSSSSATAATIDDGDATQLDDASSSAVSDSTLVHPPLPPLPITSSPLLLSQSDADANLARQLQQEENLLAQQEQRNGGAGNAFTRFFTGI